MNRRGFLGALLAAPLAAAAVARRAPEPEPHEHSYEDAITALPTTATMSVASFYGHEYRLTAKQFAAHCRVSQALLDDNVARLSEHMLRQTARRLGP